MVAKVFSRCPSKLGGASAGVIKVSVPPRFGVSAANPGMPNASNSASPAVQARYILPPWRPAIQAEGIRSERELIAPMRRPKAEHLVKPVRVGTAFVAAQLHQTTAALAALFDRPLQQLPADPVAASVLDDPHPLNLSAPAAAAGQAGNEAELQYADDPAAALGDGEKLVGVAVDRGEGVAVAAIEL